MIAFLKKHAQLIVNWIVFIGIGRWILVKAIAWEQAGELWQFVELAFLGHMILLLILVVVRTKHKAIDRNFFHQAVAMVAFFSGLAFFGEKTDDATLLLAARIVTSLALILGILTQLNLGRSFGILIAQRRIKTNFLYSLIRHPMYFTDILLKVGLLLKMPSWPNTAVLLFGVACYVYRAILEERFLAQNPDYCDYMKRVKHRFLPGIF
jgi:protein-S-isoprenylcysteine O-methyltransferase Ste14